MGKNFTLEQIPDMTGKVCIVTGGNTGIGKVCALELVKKNAHVIVASRTPSKALATIEEIKAETKSDKIEFIQLDLLSLASVTKFISEFKAKNLPLHLLLNNAGVMACPFALSEDGIESQFATNHLAHFYLTTQLLPILEQSQPSRIVNVSSSAHKMLLFHGFTLDTLNEKSKYSPSVAYARTKTCNVLFTRELDQRLQKKGVKNLYVNSNHPGIVRTELVRHNGPVLNAIIRQFSIDANDGAITQMYLATSPEVEAKDIHGQYYVPFAEPSTPSGYAATQENQTKLWDFTEKILSEKVPGYAGAGI
ncbi:hypothetical protein K450DRAFT_246083 [Umbelopsis ramanniana AG]|uniref:NAD(P)-binding protein n=1 Tax=Umbelopsis ramanniana AG TaxID=1314678 RepID=A0AAD5EAK7_UMBRA|nr:uncharacterized protein K450DRAFT_246083 [Umbelopsis ramanniana AG]KAI8578695.1 hypothetical protein K450DRAFT_246083 [Umbelopsis ramanniana AG]